MSEEIKTVLTADSSEFAAEFAKASAIAQKYAADREAQGGRALATARAEVEALRLEATGHGASAAALREKMQLTEQARRLSTQAGISEETANQILVRQLALKKQIVAATDAQAVAAQRAARIAAPGRSGMALPEQAMTAASLQAMEAGAARASELRRQLVRAGGGGYTASMGVLAFSQAVEDAQYGIRGVLNNIPQMVMGFGGGAGIAGAISLAAVAGVALYPVLKRLYGSADNDVLAKAADEWSKIFTEGTKAALAAEQASARTREMEAWSRKMNQSLMAELGIHDQILQSMDREIGIREKNRNLATEIRTAEEGLAAARGQTAGDPSAGRKEELKRILEDIATQRELSERAQAESARLNQVRSNNRETFAADESAKTAELDALRRDLAGAEANVAGYQKALDEAKKAKVDTYNDTRNLNTSTKARDELKRSIEDLKAMRDAAKAQAESAEAGATQSISQMDEKANKAYQEAEALKALLDQRKKLQAIEEATRRAASERATTDWQAELTLQRALASGDKERIRMLERQRDIEAEKRRIMAEQKGIGADLAAQRAQEMVDARAAVTAAAEKINKDRENEQRNRDRGDVMGDLKALQMEAAGDKDGADRLREELRIRSEAITMAERLNMTESDAQDILREKARLQRQITEQEKSRDRDGSNRRARRSGRIYMKRWDEGSSQRVELGGNYGLGLRNHEVERRSNERSKLPAKPGDEAARNLLKSVNIQEEMLKIWQKLNVV